MKHTKRWNKMMGTRMIKYNEKYELIEPLNKWSESYGYMMIVNSKGEVLKFFDARKWKEAGEYFDYVSLSKFEKLKYWLHYKRRNKHG